MKLDKLHTLLFAVALFAVPVGASAQTSGSSSKSSPSYQSQSSQQGASISGIVQSVDQKANTLQVKGTSSELKNLQPGQSVQLMSSSGTAAGVTGSVVRVSGEMATISATDLSAFKKGAQISLTSGSQTNNAQGLGSSSSSGSSMGSSTSGSTGTSSKENSTH